MAEGIGSAEIGQPRPDTKPTKNIWQRLANNKKLVGGLAGLAFLTGGVKGDAASANPIPPAAIVESGQMPSATEAPDQSSQNSGPSTAPSGATERAYNEWQTIDENPFKPEVDGWNISFSNEIADQIKKLHPNSTFSFRISSNPNQQIAQAPGLDIGSNFIVDDANKNSLLPIFPSADASTSLVYEELQDGKVVSSGKYDLNLSVYKPDFETSAKIMSDTQLKPENYKTIDNIYKNIFGNSGNGPEVLVNGYASIFSSEVSSSTNNDALLSSGRIAISPDFFTNPQYQNQAEQNITKEFLRYKFLKDSKSNPQSVQKLTEDYTAIRKLADLEKPKRVNGIMGGAEFNDMFVALSDQQYVRDTLKEEYVDPYSLPVKPSALFGEAVVSLMNYPQEFAFNFQKLSGQHKTLVQKFVADTLDYLDKTGNGSLVPQESAIRAVLKGQHVNIKPNPTPSAPVETPRPLQTDTLVS